MKSAAVAPETKKLLGSWFVRKSNDSGFQTSLMELTRKFRCRTLTGSIRVGVEGDEDQPVGIVAHLCELIAGQVATERAGGVAKAGLPKTARSKRPSTRMTEGAFRSVSHATRPLFDTRQESMRRRQSDAAPVEIDDSVLVETRKNDAAKEAVMPLLIY